MELTIKQIYSSLSEENSGEAAVRHGPADIVVKLANGEEYVASFFSYDKIEALRREHRISGDYLNGEYYWNKYMVLVEDCRLPAVERVVNHLLEEGEFGEVFARVSGGPLRGAGSK